MFTRTLIVTATLAAGAATFLPSGSDAAPPASTTRPLVVAPPPLAATRPVDLPGLHNFVTYADDIFCGAVPEGREGFETLKALGVKTILSVDGTLPDLDEANAVGGMRYVHLPIGYNGFDMRRELELARAVRDLPRPIYVHCHHGKHRSAGATATAMVVLGLMSPDEAVARMKVSGTAPNYVGLYQCAADARPATTQQVDAASNAFPQSATPSDMVQAMVDVDDAADNLKLIEKAGWRTPADHPDLVPAAEAGRLADLFRQLVDHHDTARSAPAMSPIFAKASADAKALEDGLAAGNVAADVLSQRFKPVMQSCKDCHATYRD